MNLVQALNLVEKKLGSLGRIEKIELYLLPSLLAIFIIYNAMEFKIVPNEEVVTALEKNQVDGYDFLKQLQKFASEKELLLLNIKQNGLKYLLHIEGEFQMIMQVILFCESYQSINPLHILKLSSHENRTLLVLEFELASYKYEPKQEMEPLTKSLEIIQNPFEKKEMSVQNQPLDVKSEPLKINAIVNQQVLINGTWINEGEVFLGNTIFKVYPHHIVIQRSNQGNKEEKTLYLVKELTQ